MIQPVLCGGESIETDLSVFLNNEESSFDAYIGVALLERVPISPEALGHKMLVGRLFNAGVKLRRLHKAFGHDNRTVRKWGEALKSGDVDVMVDAFVGRGHRKKTTPELIRYARQLYRNRSSMGLGRNYREVIISMIEEVFFVTISPSLASAIFHGAEDVDSAPGETSACSSTCGPSDVDCASAVTAGVHTSPTFPFTDGGVGGGVLLRHAGLVLFGLWLRFFAGLQRQMICQILQGAVNVEQSKSLCRGSLGRFSEIPAGGLKAQRDALEAQATQENLMEIYRQNRELIADGPNRGDLYYFDPHVKEYTGSLDVLKGWCGRRHGVAKAVNLDCFHTRSGRLCFIGHYSPYYDMRERFFMSLAQFDELFNEDKRRARTFVIDRGIFGKDAFGRFDQDYLITWEKGYDGSGWDDEAATVTFKRHRTRNHAEDLQTYSFECQKSQYTSVPGFFRILVKATNPNGRQILVSVLSNHPTMDIQDIVWVIFNRWIQENDFKYLDVHFGINQLDTRASSSFAAQADSFQDRPVDCPEYKELKGKLRNCEDKLAKRLLKLRREKTKHKDILGQKEILITKLNARMASLQDEVECLKKSGSLLQESKSGEFKDLLKSSSKFKRIEKATRKKIVKLEKEIAPLEVESDELGRRLSDAIRKKSRLDLLITGNYQFLDLRRKAYMDALRVTASNLFKNLLDRFRPLYANHRDDHDRLRMLTHCSGFLEPIEGGWKLQLWLPGTLQPHIVRAMQALADQISEKMRQDASANICIEMITGPITGVRMS